MARTLRGVFILFFSLRYGGNTKAAVIRIGLKEMVSFAKEFFGGGHDATFLESCGVADLVTTCYGGRNRKVAEALAKTRKVMIIMNDVSSLGNDSFF